ncbi:MAG TPA: FAD-dependent oxidoreductase [Armatimonadota bacterium]|nr:FAD-dependent oxidoreductase [Armatimonadota bacterium]
MPSERITEPARELPVIADVEVVVCGGGPAGTAAAVAAARAGRRTMLVERYGCLGGLATGGLVIVLPPMVRDGRQVIGGIGRETLECMLETGEAEYRSAGNPGSSRFDPEALKRHSDEMCTEAGVNLRLHSWVVGVFGQPNLPEGVIVESKAGRQAIRARQIVDCTGDGDVAALAGADFELDDKMIGMPFRIINVDLERWQQATRDSEVDTQQIRREIHEASGYEGAMGISPFPLEPGVVWVNALHGRGDFLDPAVLTRYEIMGRRAARQVTQMLRERMPGFEECWLMDTAWQIGVRCTRRITGQHRLLFEDFQAERRYDDSVALSNDFRRPDLVYEIPLRCMIPRGLDNVLVAGRCVSSDAEAMEALREIHGCWSMGEAAGAAAAMAAEHGCTPTDLPAAELRERLRGAGAVVDLPPAQ